MKGLPYRSISATPPPKLNLPPAKQRSMRIEEEIKYRKFTNEFFKLDVNIHFTSSWLQSQKNRYLKQYGVSSQQYNVLRILRGQHPKAIMLAQITERMIDRMSNATRLVEKLRIKGYVRREVNAKNRRQVDITITPAGLDLLNQLDEGWTNFVVGCYGNLTEADAKVMNDLLDKLRG
jgi:DNA-binding MarR family transcriptional regulator